MPITNPLKFVFAASLFAVVLTACGAGEVSALTTDVNYTATAHIRASWTPVPVIVANTPSVEPSESPKPSLAANTAVSVVGSATAVPPTATPTAVPPTATKTNTPTRTITRIPSKTLFPTNTKRPTITLTPSRAVTKISTLIPGLIGGSVETWTPIPPARLLNSHFVFQRPIGSDDTNYWARNYSYGSTDGGKRPIHHGVDFQNGTGTPVLAAGDGLVYYAGSDKTKIFGPQPNFYGNVIVIEHAYRDVSGQKVYTLYGHLSVIEVQTGETVKVGERIGQVGSAGVAIGPHLHLEVRVGNPTDYGATRNPELWVMPFLDYGVLVGRVMDLDGKPLYGYTVQLQSGQVYREAFSYADDTVNGDTDDNENFAIPDLPEGYYNVYVRRDDALIFRTLAYVKAGETNWININVRTDSAP
ncbi:MAG: peptidoglycan DD-metalloendopeptidase family protein [Chloroflexota bacterium]